MTNLNDDATSGNELRLEFLAKDLSRQQEKAQATDQGYKRQLEEISPDTVMKAIVHQGARIDQVEKQLAALATSLVTLATGLNQHFVESEERSARATAELDALIDRVLELPAKTRRKHGLEFPDSIRERRRAGEFNVIDRRTP